MHDTQPAGTSSSDRTAVLTQILARLDRLPWGRFHTKMTLALGFGWVLDAFEITIIGSIIGVLSKQWGLSPVQGSYAVTTLLLGVLVGAIGFGVLADRYGRKRMFYVTLLWYGAFTVISAFSVNYEMFLVLRFLAAIGLGGEYSAINSAMAEFVPKNHRGRTDALIQSGYPIGGVLAAVVALTLLKLLPADIAWRGVFFFGFALAILAAWIRVALPESPRWLVNNGRVAEAEALVDKIERSIEQERGITLEPVPVPQLSLRDANGKRESFAKMLRGRYLGRLALAGSLNFSQAAVVYGVLTLMALVLLPHAGVPPAQIPIYYAYANVAAIVGGLVAALMLDAAGRKVSLALSYCLCIAAIIGLSLAGTISQVMAGYAAVQLTVTWAYISAYVVTAEVLATRLRATGVGIAVAFGRIGAAVTPFVVTAVYATTHDVSRSVLTMLLFAIPGPIAALLWAWRGCEGRRQPLESLTLEVNTLETVPVIAP
jgi:MFS family permease